MAVSNDKTTNEGNLIKYSSRGNGCCRSNSKLTNCARLDGKKADMAIYVST
jgi:hypothetical protein